MCNSEQKNYKQYIVALQNSSFNTEQKSSGLLEILSLVKNHPDMSIVKIVGEENNPQRLIIWAKPEAVNYLQSNFQGKCIIEPDQPLELY